MDVRFQIERKEAISSRPPTPFLPSTVSAVVALLLTALILAALWQLQHWRKPIVHHTSFARHKENAQLFICLLFLNSLMVASLSFPSKSHITTCRCCLFSVRQACGLAGPRVPTELPSNGFYYFSTVADETYAGVYASGIYGVNQFGSNKFAFEDISADRTRFGWPLRAITLDAVPQKSEWHIVFEFWANVNLFVCFLGWSIVQPIVSFFRRRFGLGRSAEIGGAEARVY